MCAISACAAVMNHYKTLNLNYVALDVVNEVRPVPPFATKTPLFNSTRVFEKFRRSNART